MYKNLIYFILFFALSTTGCFHVHAVNQDILLPTAGKPIEYHASKTIWFRFNSENEFVEEARQEFLRMCKGGTIHSTTSRLSSENSFLHWNYNFKLTGICVKG